MTEVKEVAVARSGLVMAAGTMTSRVLGLLRVVLLSGIIGATGLTAEAFQVQVPLRSLFEGPTVAEQALVVEALLMAELDALDDAEAERLLAADESEHGGNR